MYDILCVTNRKLCKGDFLERIEQIAMQHPAGIILREKDLSEQEYEKLAQQVLFICNKHQVPCILHNFPSAAFACEMERIHLPLSLLRKMTSKEKAYFEEIGVSCHSLEDALEAQQLGATYLTAGHIFETDCKKGLPGRGLDFLTSVCKNVSIPVYGIGGITSANIADIKSTGAKGACIMSGLMQCDDVAAYFHHASIAFLSKRGILQI